jgi:hypothetical protein
MKNSNNTIGNRTRVLPSGSAMPQPLRHHVPRPKRVSDYIFDEDTLSGITYLEKLEVFLILTRYS